MSLFQFSFLLHIIGIGLLFTALFGGWALNAQYGRASDWGVRTHLLRALRTIGLLSPLGTGLMLVSGIVNMVLDGFSVTSPAWLGIKLLCFVVLAATGVVAGILGGKRSALAEAVAAGGAPEDAERRIDAIQRRLRTFSLFQFVLILVILVLSIVKPFA